MGPVTIIISFTPEQLAEIQSMLNSEHSMIQVDLPEFTEPGPVVPAEMLVGTMAGPAYHAPDSW